MDFLEKCCERNSTMLTGSRYIESFTDESSCDNIINFREAQCKNNTLEFKNKPVKNENAPHIFPGLEFINKPCNPCDKKCGISIKMQLDSEEYLVYPKMSDNWVYNVWNTWFSEDTMSPGAYNSNNIHSNLL
jgi:hypothetical protein